MKRFQILLVSLLLLCNNGFAANIVESAGKNIPETKVIFKTIIDEKRELLSQLNEEKKTLELEKDSILKTIKPDIEENANKRIALERELQKYPDDEFLTKKLSLLTEIHDTENDLLRFWEGLLKKTNDLIVLLENYLKDPELKNYTRDLKISAGPYFFEDLEELHQKINSQQKYVDQLKKRRESLAKEQKSLAQLVDKSLEEYKERKTKQEEFSKVSVDGKSTNAPFGFTVQQRAELLSLEGMLYKLKKDLAELQLKEKKQEALQVENELFVENSHLEVVQDIQQTIKSSITVTPEQIESGIQELEKRKQAFSALKTKYNDEINKLRKFREDEGQKLSASSARYGIALGSELNTWAIEPKKTLESYKNLTEVGALNAYILLLDDREAYFSALIALEQEKINYAEDVVRVKETYYKITSHKFASEDEITQEIKKYSSKLVATENSLKALKAKKDEVEATLLKLQNEVLERLKKRKLDIQRQRDTLFKNHLNEYAVCLSLIEKAEEYVLFRMDIVGSTGKSYAENIAVLDKIAGHSKFILSELESITIWYRPEYAITWAGIQNVPNDIKLFMLDLRSYLMQFELSSLFERVKDSFKKPLLLFLHILLSLGLLFIFMCIRRYVSSIIAWLKSAADQYPGLNVIALFGQMMVGFIAQYATTLYLWCLALLMIKRFMMPDPYLYILFYLISVPWLLYLAQRFVVYLMEFNRNKGYCFFALSSASTINIFSVLLYSTIVITLLRHAFMMAHVPRTEVPIILLALNFIIFSLSVLLLVTKDHVLNLIPTKSDIGQMIYDFVDRYYYFIMVCIGFIVVLSNPYIGYGRLVSYILQGVVYTIILLKVLHWLHGAIKRMASATFFSSTDEVVRERFAYAKTWFGIAIIGSFLLLAFLGLVIGAKIWGWPIAFKDMFRLLNQPLLGIGKGTSNPLTLLTLLTIVFFIIGGFVVSFAFNKFVLEKIFELMLVDAGVQNAITSFTRYALVAAAILLGFQSVGYGGLITYFYVLILGIGYLIQNPLNDLIAYFILLVQRPIKVGDYIKLDDEVSGVVRKITPKSVVVRCKNSTTIVIPNTQIINKPVVNWNYSRNFIAFNDILVTVSYKNDPAKIKEILFSVVDAHPKVLKNPKPVIRLEDFREYGYEFMVRGFLSSNYTLEQWDVASDVRLGIVKALRDNGMEIAVPIRVIVSSAWEDDASKDRAPVVKQ